MQGLLVQIAGLSVYSCPHWVLRFCKPSPFTHSRPLFMLQTILFDLDGTLADTAPDLAAALNHILQQAGRAALSEAQIRPWVSHGARYMIAQGFGMAEDDAAMTPLWQQLVAYYRAHIAVHTRLFPGMEQVLGQIEQQGLSWGIVTNKPAWLTDPLVMALGLETRSACTVSGDTLSEKKPHPAPLLHACALAGSRPEGCLYVGDAARDIEAGRRAGMRTAVALFGYLGSADQPQTWGADLLLQQPVDLLACLPAATPV